MCLCYAVNTGQRCADEESIRRANTVSRRGTAARAPRHARAVQVRGLHTAYTAASPTICVSPPTATAVTRPGDVSEKDVIEDVRCCTSRCILPHEYPIPEKTGRG